MNFSSMQRDNKPSVFISSELNVVGLLNNIHANYDTPTREFNYFLITQFVTRRQESFIPLKVATVNT